MMKLLEVKHLNKNFPITKGIFKKKIGQFKAVDDVSFYIHPGEILGLVGESGSGKSTLAKLTAKLMEPSSGEIYFLGENLSSLCPKRLFNLRPKFQMVFQDPLSSLNPRKNVLDNISEALVYHKIVKSRESQINETKKILQKVGLTEAALYQYPHEFSGGQRQRISIARALALKPKLIICDEILSALDLSVQAQILNLLMELRQSEKIGFLFISHDLSIVSHLCDRVLVMYKGQIAESGKVEEIFNSPKHPYTEMLLASIPKNHPQEKKMPPAFKTHKNTKHEGGCSFFSRCSKAKPSCETLSPPEKKIGSQSYKCIL